MTFTSLTPFKNLNFKVIGVFFLFINISILSLLFSINFSPKIKRSNGSLRLYIKFNIFLSPETFSYKYELYFLLKYSLNDSNSSLITSEASSKGISIIFNEIFFFKLFSLLLGPNLILFLFH